jgi:hypothetical protein
MTPPAERRNVLELKRELEAETRELAERGVCGCGCGEELGGKGGNGRALFRDVRHRQRFRRRMLKRLAEASGIPANLSVQTLQATDSTAERNGDAQRARKRPRRAPRPGVSIYLPTLDDAQALEGWVELGVRLAEERPDELAIDLEPALDAIVNALERRRRRPAA